MLTGLTIRQIKSTGGQQEQAVGGVAGLTIRINQAGTKTFFLAFRAPATGKAARMRLGEYNSKHFPLERARELGRFYRSLIDQGTDPRDYLRAEADHRTREEEEARRADGQRKASTFSVVVEDYVAKFQVAKKQNRTWSETKRLLLVNCAAWLLRPVSEITRRDVHGLLDQIMAEGKCYSANRTYAVLKTFLPLVHQPRPGPR